MLDDDTMSFAGAYDYRVSAKDTCKRCGTTPDQVCLPLLVSSKPVDGKNYTQLCLSPEEHGELSSPIHKRTLQLRAKFRENADDLIDKSHTPDDVQSMLSPQNRSNKRRNQDF